MRPAMTRSLVSLVVLAGLASCSTPLGPLPDGLGAGATPTRIAFTLTPHNNISVPALFNGTDRVNLMFHTAAGAVFLTRDAVRRLTSLHFDAEASVRSWGGQDAVRYSSGNHLQIGELIWDDVGVTEDRHSGRLTDGKFGPHLFEGRVLELDFDRELLTVHAELPPLGSAWQRLELEDRDGNWFVRGSFELEGERLERAFLVHSGFSGALLFDDEFVAQGRLEERLEPLGSRELRDSIGNVLKTTQVRLPNFRLGRTELREVPGEFFAGAVGGRRMSVLGGDVLKRFHLFIDAGNGALYLRPAGHFDEPFS